MKVFTPMMAKINQKMMHTVNTLKMLDIIIIDLGNTNDIFAIKRDERRKRKRTRRRRNW